MEAAPAGVDLSTSFPSEHRPPRFLQDVVFHGKLKVGSASWSLVTVEALKRD